MIVKIRRGIKNCNKKVGEGIIRRPLKEKEITYSDPFELCSKVYIMMHAKYEKAPYRRAEVVDFLRILQLKKLIRSVKNGRKMELEVGCCYVLRKQ